MNFFFTQILVQPHQTNNKLWIENSEFYFLIGRKNHPTETHEPDQGDLGQPSDLISKTEGRHCYLQKVTAKKKIFLCQSKSCVSAWRNYKLLYFSWILLLGKDIKCSEYIHLTGNHRTSATRKQGSCQLITQGYPWHMTEHHWCRKI